MAVTEEELAKLRVVDLKAKLSELGLPTQGLKSELVERLYQHLLAQEEAANMEEDKEAALKEKQREEHEKQVQLLRLQREALKQKEEEHKIPAAPAGAPGITAPIPRASAPAPVTPVPPGVGTVPVLGPPGVKASVVVPPPATSFTPHPQGPINVGGPAGFTGPAPIPSAGLLGPAPGSVPKSTPSPQQPPLRPPLLQTATTRAPTSIAAQRPPMPMANTSPRPPGAGLLGAAPPTMGPPGENQDKNEKPPPLMSLHVTAPKEETPREVKLPQALEQALAFKTERAKQVGVNPEDVEKVEREGLAGMDELESLPPQPRPPVPVAKTQPSFIPTGHFAKIFEAFRIAEPEPKVEEEKVVPKTEIPLVDPKKLGSKRMSIAELKQTVSRPDVVEMHDVTAKDPKLLVHLKATRNTVPVPRHWCFKRKYLQGKRGIEKPPFELPDFIKRTGIMEMRAALQEKEDQKTLKAKMRDKVRPKMGKIDIDYQKLHDAFFKWQTKPKMTIHGDLYYEGKEFETKMKDKKPGEMSDDLRIALGMPVGANAHKVPPPWLIAMQRYGPPPSYPNLKIPGLNSPIPEGCSFGYHAGGWGKPPVDNMGISSLPAGLETPDMIELRKKRMETEMEGGDTPALYTILPEKRTETMGRAMMGSTHTYDLGAAGVGGAAARSAPQGVEVALDPSELDLVDTDAMAARYEATLREQQKGEEEDFSDMVAEHAAKQRNKRRKQQQDQAKPAKKYKDFKF
ncbi:putative splicing factor 3B subunit 2 isoform X3 [Penaeus vannamei]|uniref:Putative splicing factor 3B subunit 2 isoform X3 n=1 Tax=Penaeus vannamei TaxID=6689 RepID=A0A423U8S1_PENVA|nr:putative splicing factor 3B subunit 2 isoform X3 [Penaeus vannamei]